MSSSRIAAPKTDEYAPYYQVYLDTLPEGDVLEMLEQQMHLLLDLLLGLTDEEADFRYAEGKWSIKEVIGHMIDTERIFASRVLSFARGETAALPGYDQDVYVRNGDFAGRSRGSLSGEYEGLRKSNLFLFPSFGEEVQQRRGVADGKEMSVRALPWIIAGHERHHFSVLNERYLPHL
jgi:hypothetical protein